MSVVKADQPPTVGSMERHGVLQSVRLFRRSEHPPDTKVDPVLAGRIDDECFAIQIQQAIESRIPPGAIWL